MQSARRPATSAATAQGNCGREAGAGIKSDTHPCARPVRRVRACVHACVHACVISYRHAYTWRHAYQCSCTLITHVCVCVCVCVFCMCVCGCVCMCVYVYIYVYIYTYMYMYIFIHKYMNMYICKYVPAHGRLTASRSALKSWRSPCGRPPMTLPHNGVPSSTRPRCLRIQECACSRLVGVVVCNAGGFCWNGGGGGVPTLCLFEY